MKKYLLLSVLCVFSYAWDGYDYKSGSFVEIDKGNVVRSGRDIEIYDYKDGRYKDVEVQSVQRYGNTVEVEVYDREAHQYRVFDMDK